MGDNRLTRAEIRELEWKVARLPVRQADLIIDRAFHASGIAWLRRSGWLRPQPVDTDRPVDTAHDQQRRAS